MVNFTRFSSRIRSASSLRKYLVGLSCVVIVIFSSLLLYGPGLSFLARHFTWKDIINVTTNIPLAIALLTTAVAIILWLVPKRQVRRSRGVNDENWFDRENEARKTLAQIIGGLFLVAGLYTSLKSYDLAREGAITDRFGKAMEQIAATNIDGTPKMEVRIGGMYALGRYARTSESDNVVVIEVLTSYIRMHSPSVLEERKSGPVKPSPDIVTAAEILDHTDPMSGPDSILHRLDLSGTNLSGLEFSASGKNYEFAKWDHSDLRGATFLGPDLSDASFEGSRLENAEFIHTDLSDVTFDSCKCAGVHFRSVYLKGASLKEADLSHADFDLVYDSFIGVNLSGADLSTATGLPDHLFGVIGDDKTKIPISSDRPPDWDIPAQKAK